MYFPYLRGRQYELIALRELLQKNLLSKKIIPIIEPVRLSTTLVNTIDYYGQEGRTLAIITDPIVGNFRQEFYEQKNEKMKKSLIDACSRNQDILYVVILKNNLDTELFGGHHRNNVMTICLNTDSIRIFEEQYSDVEVRYNLFPDESVYRRRIRNNRVILENRFMKKERNYDYINIDDEPFSEDHLYYNEDGYVGFSDYSVVGKDYSDTGFAPYAIAIHIVYFDEDNSLRIKHFVSESNEDINDPAGKFQEALTKLIRWNGVKKLQTVAMHEFEDLFQREAYPGLGTVKKLSIMHHLELIGNFLDKE